MDEVREKVVTADPATGTSQVVETQASVPSHAEVKEAKADKKNQWVWYIIGLIDVLLVLRLLFLLFGARNVGIASLIYSITDPLVSLFRGVFASPRVEGAYFDTAALLAIAVYSLIGWGIASLINVMSKPAKPE